ncbi:hypothetical protein EMCG_03576 [[Emmonsia] crescens]|uniref:Uncharacterized protein n=1 Tax=[Emmonsia] crescens TaxID=73230 RepID=A0A0G2J018_9EURO|nr:hypothetical protein EMCG_03576 [Emmonsia crescens UAMH 3008]
MRRLVYLRTPLVALRTIKKQVGWKISSRKIVCWVRNHKKAPLIRLMSLTVP